MLLKRRGLLTGMAALFAAPAIIRTPGLLMPVKAAKAEMVRMPGWAYFRVTGYDQFGNLFTETIGSPLPTPGNMRLVGKDPGTQEVYWSTGDGGIFFGPPNSGLADVGLAIRSL